MRKVLVWLLIAMLPACALASALTADAEITVHGMSDTLYGLFFEDINHSADGGLYAELLQNRSFEYEDLLNPRTVDHFSGWSFGMTFGAKGHITLMTEGGLNENNPTYVRVTAEEGAYRFANMGYSMGGLGGGVPVAADTAYRSFVYLRSAGFEGEVSVALTTRAGDALAEPVTIRPTDDWQRYDMTFDCTTQADAVLSFTLLGAGDLDVDMASLMPAERFGSDWPGGGLRSDLVEALMELHPKFLRFPGGCVAEGSYVWENAYNWKDTVGPVEQRKENFNTWGYMQSYGLGYYEYFCLAEALGAQPLPVVHSGVLCQARNPREASIPIAELSEYAQDIIDLIEFATGDESTPWGALRAEMGHPEPFDLHYIAIGNENWDMEYFTRYKRLAEAVKAVYPDITTIVAAGPVAEGALIQSSWNTIRSQFADSVVDEHYYMDSDWFLTHTNRYDSYSRNTGVFLGEYAAHEPVIGGRRPSNLYAALCEAAYLTGIERNSDVVRMACYAPLMARDGMFQWSPNLIWFNSREVLRTPSYYVQQMFAETLGDSVVDSALETANDRLYQVVTRTDDALYVKVVNVSENEEELTLSLSNVPDGVAACRQLSGERNAVNSFAQERVAPVSGECAIAGGQAKLTLPAYSVTILTFALSE